MKQFRQFFTLILLPLDYLMVLAGFVLAYRLKLEFPIVPVIYIQPFADYWQSAIYFSLIWLIVFFGFGLYRFRGFHNGWELFSKIAVASTMALALFIIGLFLTKTYFFSRLTIIYFWPLSILMVMAGRAMLDFIKNWLQNYGLGVEEVIVIGADKTATELAAYYKKMQPNFHLAKTLAAIDFGVLETTANLNRIVVGYEPDKAEMIKLIRWCEDRGVTLQYVPSLVGIYASRLMVESLDGYPIIELSPTPLAGWGRIVKRIFDLVLTSIGLIVASPFMLIIALLVKYTSKGPIIFAQKRVGELGKEFTFYKFRSMYAELSTGEGYGGKEAEALLEKLRAEGNEADGPMFKMTNDPRVTPVGNFIRRTSLDELPQLFNVLLGNMSLVGPRPALPNEVAQYNDNAKRRLLVKPGVTGMWQVSGRNDVSFDEYVRLDIYYIEHWSLWLDIKIILQTIRAVFARTGK
jgi:exopolysaccharide biosynthesis polyprenyl glycosylphosphotransferase